MRGGRDEVRLRRRNPGMSTRDRDRQPVLMWTRGSSAQKQTHQWNAPYCLGTSNDQDVISVVQLASILTLSVFMEVEAVNQQHNLVPKKLLWYNMLIYQMFYWPLQPTYASLFPTQDPSNRIPYNIQGPELQTLLLRRRSGGRYTLSLRSPEPSSWRCSASCWANGERFLRTGPFQ